MRSQLLVPRDAPDWMHQFVGDLVRELDRAEEREGGPRIRKSILIDRMTDAECGLFDTMLGLVSPRERLKWGAISAVYLNAPDYPDFKQEIIDNFGASRAAQLLRPTD